MIIEVTMRDLYLEGKDTVILQGKLAERYKSTPYKSNFLVQLETVEFSHPYVISEKYL
jgi:hypothetical protein